MTWSIFFKMLKKKKIIVLDYTAFHHISSVSLEVLFEFSTLRQKVPAGAKVPSFAGIMLLLGSSNNVNLYLVVRRLRLPSGEYVFCPWDESSSLYSLFIVAWPGGRPRGRGAMSQPDSSSLREWAKWGQSAPTVFNKKDFVNSWLKSSEY